MAHHSDDEGREMAAACPPLSHIDDDDDDVDVESTPMTMTCQPPDIVKAITGQLASADCFAAVTKLDPWRHGSVDDGASEQFPSFAKEEERTLEKPLNLTEAELKANQIKRAEITARIEAALALKGGGVPPAAPAAQLSPPSAPPTPGPPSEPYRSSPRDPEAKETVAWARSLLLGTAAQQEHGAQIVSALASASMEGRYRKDLFAEGQAGAELASMLVRVAEGGGEAAGDEAVAKARIAALKAACQIVAVKEVSPRWVVEARSLPGKIRSEVKGVLSNFLLYEASALEEDLNDRG